MKLVRSLLWWVALIAVSLSTMLWLDKIARPSSHADEDDGHRAELKKLL